MFHLVGYAFGIVQLIIFRLVSVCVVVDLHDRAETTLTQTACVPCCIVWHRRKFTYEMERFTIAARAFTRDHNLFDICADCVVINYIFIATVGFNCVSNGGRRPAN